MGGSFTVKKVYKLAKPVICHSAEIGEAHSEPCLVNIDWEGPPSEGKHEFWFPYLDHNRREGTLWSICSHERGGFSARAATRGDRTGFFIAIMSGN